MRSLMNWDRNMEQHIFWHITRRPNFTPVWHVLVRWAWNLHACVLGLGVTVKPLWVCDVKTFNDFVFAIRFPFCPMFRFPANDLDFFLSHVVKWMFVALTAAKKMILKSWWEPISLMQNPGYYLPGSSLSHMADLHSISWSFYLSLTCKRFFAFRFLYVASVLAGLQSWASWTSNAGRTRSKDHGWNAHVAN